MNVLLYEAGHQSDELELVNKYPCTDAKDSLTDTAMSTIVDIWSVTR